jgi:hypothetical protein
MLKVKLLLHFTHSLLCIQSKSSKCLHATTDVGFHKASSVQRVCGDGSECLVLYNRVECSEFIVAADSAEAVQIMEAARATY